MEYGPSIFALDEATQVVIRSSGSFTVFSMDEREQRLRVLGPDSSVMRYWKTVVPRGTHAIEVHCEKETAYEVELSILPKRTEDIDTTPAEIPVSAQKPETLEEIMARMIETRFNMMAEERGAETFEESDDFDIDDDDDFGTSPYEFVDMDPEEPFYPDVEKNPPPEDRARSAVDKEPSEVVASDPVELDQRNDRLTQEESRA